MFQHVFRKVFHLVVEKPIKLLSRCIRRDLSNGLAGILSFSETI